MSSKFSFNKHDYLQGQHAFLGPSKYHWVNYDDEKLFNTYLKHQATIRGVRLHDFAKECIELGIKLPRSKKTLNMYVNDCIGFNMVPEQPLIYSTNAFGTVDAISFKRNTLRIHDLKTGVTPASMKQLEVYAALFCLEYKIKPQNIDIELRLYQSDEVIIQTPPVEDILFIMDKIIMFDKQIEKIKIGE